MKLIGYSCLLFIVVLLISSCMANQAVATPLGQRHSLPHLHNTPPTTTPIAHPTQTATLTPPPTLEPEQAKETIIALLQDSVDCDAPCLWEIVPGQTSLGGAKNIFAWLGLDLELTLTEGQRKFYAVVNDLDNGLSITVILTIQNDLVENSRLYISPEKVNMGVPRAWSAYSPETLISRYGTPSKVDLFIDGGSPSPTYFMDMYFDSKKLIVEYVSHDLGPNLLACPLTDQMTSVRLWMGEDPVDPPLEAVLLEEATSLTVEEFSKLMTGDPKQACFNLNIEAFQ